MTTRRPRVSFLCVLAAWWSIALLSSTTTTTTNVFPHVFADSIEDEYVRQVIEEDQQHYGHGYHDDRDDDEPRGDDDVDEDQRRREAEERAAREEADRIAADRERSFQAEVDRMKDEEQKKLALRQKKIDGVVVRSVLKAAQRNDLYGVLGLRGWTLVLPPRTVAVASVRLNVPGLALIGPATEKQIRKQFRNRAKQVHPDKNRDGRAGEAFVAVEHAASVLSDPAQRKAYDAARKQNRDETLGRWKAVLGKGLATAVACARTAFGVAQTLLGPFFVPVVILLALII